jgi:hypothetical protein
LSSAKGSSAERRRPAREPLELAVEGSDLLVEILMRPAIERSAKRAACVERSNSLSAGCNRRQRLALPRVVLESAAVG